MNSFERILSIVAIVTSLLIWLGSGDLFAQGHERPSHGPGSGMHRPPSVDQVFAKDDTDGDGLISEEEFGGPAGHFPMLDTDSDGYLTREEVTEAMKNAPPPPGRRGGRGQGGPLPGSEHFEDRFTQSDTNGDGVLSRDEFRGPADHFAAIDANENGVLEEEELEQAGPPRPPGNTDSPPCRPINGEGMER